MTNQKRLSIAAAIAPDTDDVVTPQQHDVVTSKRSNVATSKGKAVKPRSHSSFYVAPKVLKTLREIALARDCKVNDLIIEGLRIVLEKHGRDFDRLNR